MKINILITVVSLAALFVSCKSTNKNGVLEGKVKRETLSIAPKIPGRIVEIRVNEGDIAKEGDTLAIIDIPEVEAKLLQAEGAVLSATSQYEMSLNGATKEQVRQAVAMYDAASEQFEFAEKSLQRVKNMFADSLVPAQKYDEAFAKYTGAKAQLEAAEAKKEEVMSGVRNEKIKMAEGQMKQAQGALAEAKVAYNERHIIAPKNMTIETIALNEGELALPGYNIFVGYRMDKVYFRITAKESLIKYFENGKRFKITLPFENIKTNAKLIAIKQLPAYANRTSSFPDYEIGESLYELKLVPENINDANKLYNNYTVLLEEYK